MDFFLEILERDDDNNINKEKAGPNVVTVGAQQPLNNFSDLVRQEMASQGFSEVLTWILCSHDDNFANVNREDDGNAAAIVANPSSLDVQVARSSLLQGVLKAMGANKDAPVPAKLFEVGDVVLLDDDETHGWGRRCEGCEGCGERRGSARVPARSPRPALPPLARSERFRRGGGATRTGQTRGGWTRVGAAQEQGRDRARRVRRR